MKLIFATNNQHKIDEIQFAVGNAFELVTLKGAGIDIEIPEPHPTLEENASEKSRTIYQLTGINCFSEDTGLEVKALGGEPGVRSARYAGEDKSFDKNIQKLLRELEGKKDRSARFRTVISLIIDGKEHFFEGICEGTVGKTSKGAKGFGYDPVFYPLGSPKTFAEMPVEEKHIYSHRRHATDQLVSFLRTRAENIC